MNSKKRITLKFIICSLFVYSSAQAEWWGDGTRICWHSVYNKVAPQAIPDGNGGATISWIDYFCYGDCVRRHRALRAQRIDGDGNLLWGENGMEMSVGDPILESNVTRRIDFALFMVEALTNDALIRKAPAIVGCRTPSALAAKQADYSVRN
jgi:hypothetical protein